MRHVFVESNWVFGCCAPTHRQLPEALSLIEEARNGNISLHVPSICLREGAEAIRQKCQPRADDVRNFVRSALERGLLSAAQTDETRRFLQLYTSTISRELEDVQAKADSLRELPGIDVFGLTDDVAQRVFDVRHVPDLKPFDEIILAAILVRNNELREAGVATDTSFCELDGDLRPWDKQGRRREPLCTIYDDARIWVYGDFGLRNPPPPAGWPNVRWANDKWTPIA